MGWARANILYDRSIGLPDPGSPMEILYLVLWRMRQAIEFHKSRALIQALMSQEGVESEHIKKAFEDLREAFFPFEDNQRKVEIEKLKKILDKELKRGPLRVTPLVDLTRAQLKHRLDQGQATMKEHAELLRRGKLRMLDRDPFKGSRRRTHSASSHRRGSAKRVVPRTHRRG